MVLDIIHRVPAGTRRHRLVGDSARLGSDPSCDVVLEGAGVERIHATVSREGRGYVLTAASPTAGLEVRGRRVRSLALGALTQVMLAGARVTFVVAGEGGAEEPGDARACVRSSARLDGIDALQAEAPSPRAEARAPQLAGAEGLLHLVHEAALALVAESSVEGVADVLVELLFGRIRVDRALVLLTSAGDERLAPAAFRSRHDGAREAVTYSRSIAAHAQRARRALLFDVAADDVPSEVGRSAAAHALRSAMAAPLLSGGESLGVLYVDRCAATFTDDELRSFAVLAQLGASAFARHALAERLRRERRDRARLSRYLDAAVVEQVLANETAAGLCAEVRDVTVLFADIVDFSGLCDRLPPARLQAVLNLVLAALADEVFRELGTLDKFIGDEVLAFFGAPLRQPDHAARAVRAGTAMLRRVASLRAELGDLPDLALRVGISTGPVLVGDFGAPFRRDYTVVGDTVNAAKRLQVEVARRGEVVVDGATRALCGDTFAFEALPVAHLRGRSTSARPWRVVEGGAAPGA